MYLNKQPYNTQTSSTKEKHQGVNKNTSIPNIADKALLDMSDKIFEK